MKSLQEIFGTITKFGYLKAELQEQTIHGIKFLPLGSTLLDKITNEWLKNKCGIITYSTPPNESIYNITDSSYFNNKKNLIEFLKAKEFRDNFLHVKNNFQKEFPLAIKEQIQFENTCEMTSSDLGICISRGKFLISNFFVSESIGVEQFYKIQRERKIWWMKLSSHPGRYYLSNLKTDMLNNYKTQSVQIISKFNFGDIELENLHFIPLKALDLKSHEDFYLKNSRSHKTIPTLIRSEICLEKTALGLLLDSVEETKTEKISIHRKLAPYQCALFCLAEELEDLETHLTDVIRKSGITVFNLQKSFMNNKKLLNDELLRMDGMGVPYSIILEPTSLQNGLMKLRSRDTTISEIIHITDVPEYLAKIFNS